MLSTALGAASGVSSNASIDEHAIQQDHEKAYGQGQAGNMSASSMGSAAAIQAFKSFASSGGLSGGQQQGGQSILSKLLGMAMAEAAKVSQSATQRGEG